MIFEDISLSIRKAFDIHFVTNESDNKLILFERRFDVIFTSFSSSFKVTPTHLHQRIDEHRNSAIGRHVKEKHGEDAERVVNCFSVLRKCQGKYDCLLHEMLYIKPHKPSLNTQSDSIQAK